MTNSCSYSRNINSNNSNTNSSSSSSSTNVYRPRKILNFLQTLLKNQGPYGVLICSKRPNEGPTPRLHRYAISKLIFNKCKIDHIVPKSQRKIEVLCSNIHEANKLVTDQEILSKNCDIFIPSHRLVRKGVIRGVDTDIEDQDISADLRSCVEVASVKRLTKRNRAYSFDESQPKRIPTTSISITFVGQDLPRFAYLYGISHDVHPYFASPRICFSCYKPGHTSTYCKSEALCRKCGDKRHDGTCASEKLKCPACQGEHAALDKMCPIMIREKRVQYIIATENKSFDEARKIASGDFVPQVPHATKESFPRISQHNSFHSVNRWRPLSDLYQDSDQVQSTYSEVVGQNKTRSPPPARVERRSFTQPAKIHSQESTKPKELRRDWFKYQKKNCPYLSGNEHSSYQPRFSSLPVKNTKRTVEGSIFCLPSHQIQRPQATGVEEIPSSSRRLEVP
ncbi:uncharacterized protein LOC106641717 [Copidosoma floridanum]|uniref:uncharacterized protein LOC106641717 n=1 Tax=Copidosoma floridanum TaxID=29053 RepID=UPI0006C9B854|nr:uncharacterized protein LOC106641717 [Copidosoma floridanum]